MVWQVGDDMSVEDGAAAARLVALNMLATLKRELASILLRQYLRRATTHFLSKVNTDHHG